MLNHIENKNGFATIIAILMVGMLTLIGLAVLSTSDDEVQISGNELQEMRSFYAAEAGLDAAAAALQNQYEATGLPPTTMPSGADSVNQCLVAYSTNDNGAASQRILSTGTLAGLHALVKTFTITSVAISQIESGHMRMNQTFETALVPIFQFAVFYNQDFEIDPGPDMTLKGRVHANGDMYLNPAGKLSMDSYVTSAKRIMVGPKGTDPMKSGSVRIKDGDGNYVTMKSGGYIMDHNNFNWYDSAIVKWDGRVQDEAHGVEPLNVPLTSSSDPHKIIERSAVSADSYENKATLKIVDGQAYEYSGSVWNNVTADMISKGIISYSSDKFYDQRESEWVDCTELDVKKLYDEGYDPDNGVLYFSDDISMGTEWPALRIRNAQELDDGLTIASENPVYTVGNFNSVNKKPASILSDALTVLSSNFDDSKSTMSKTYRNAVNTTVNVSYITGGVETVPGVESGGFHNLPRFLEVWSGRTFTWTGSAVHLWYSRQATATWRPESGGYYSAPTRVWSYDTDLDDPNKLPPETPVVRVFERTGWKQDYVGYTQEDIK